MNKELLEDRWTEAKEYIRERFSNLTDEDIRQINGRYDQLVSRLQQRYGFTKEQAEAEIKKWAPELGSKRVLREAPPYQTSRLENTHYTKEKENSSLLNWLLLAGLPLMFLLGYYANHMSHENTTPYTTNEELILVNETPSDQLLSQNIRKSLALNENYARLLDNIRITSSNGTVTASGTVATPEQRDSIIRMIQNTPGVTDVTNKIRIK